MAASFFVNVRCAPLRKLLWFTVGFAVACALGVYLYAGWWTALIYIAVAAIVWLLRKPQFKFILVIILGLIVGTLWQSGYRSLYVSPLDPLDGQKLTTTVTVSDFGFQTDYGTAADGYVKYNKLPYKIRVYLSEERELKPGDSISGVFRMRLTTADSLQGSTHHSGDGIFLLAYAEEDATVQTAGKTPVLFMPAVLREEITQILNNVFSGEILAFSRALLLGDDSLLTYETDTAFKLSGIRHMIAVSGLHVSILFACICMFSGKHRVLTAILGLPALFLFAAVAGFTPSVVRACVMQGVMILGLLFKQEYDPPTSLSFAVAGMLIVNPLTITSVSFQLSVVCVSGILLFYDPLNSYLLRKVGQPKGYTRKTRFLRWLCASIAVSISAAVAATPLSAVYFGTVSLVGVLTNLLTMWVVSFLFYGIMVCCILGAIWLPGAVILGKVIAIPIQYVLFVAKLMSKPYYACLYTSSVFAVLFLLFAYVLFFLFLLGKPKRPGIFVACLSISLCFTLLFSYWLPRLDQYRVSVLDVGQGQSILFQSKGKNYLVDCGGDSDKVTADKVAATLLSQGITSLDGIILTHYDDDHAGGVLPLMSRISTKQLYLPEVDDSGSIRETLTKHHADLITWVTEETKIQEEMMSFTLFPGKNNTLDTESGLCILFQRENCAILITGDRNIKGEKYLLEDTELPKLDALIIGHHGSNTSTDLSLLYQTKPDIAVISVGKNNYYGHPSDAVLERLKIFGCHIYRTDIHGTILFRG